MARLLSPIIISTNVRFSSKADLDSRSLLLGKSMVAITMDLHLFDVTGDWYGSPVSVDVVRRLRDTTRFASADALVAQLARDADEARVALTQA